MLAVKASRLAWSAMASITLTTSPTSAEEVPSLATVVLVVPATSTALATTFAASLALGAM